MGSPIRAYIGDEEITDRIATWQIDHQPDQPATATLTMKGGRMVIHPYERVEIDWVAPARLPWWRRWFYRLFARWVEWPTETERLGMFRVIRVDRGLYAPWRIDLMDEIGFLKSREIPR